jgi:lactoylglutathione lyase
MARIVHLAMRVEDIDRAAEFYTKVFGFKVVTVPGLRSTVRYLTDGNVHIAINRLRKEKNEQPAIDHFGVEVDSVEKCLNEVAKFGCKIVSEPGRLVKFGAPGGIVIEPVPAGSKPGLGE